MKFNSKNLNPFDKIYGLPFSASAAAGAGGGGGKEDPEDYFWFKNEDTEIGYIQLKKNGYAGTLPTLTFEYSTDKENWEQFTLTNTNDRKTFLNVQPGETYYIRGIGNDRLHDTNNPYERCGLQIGTTNDCKHSIGGNIMSLYDYKRMWKYTEIGDYEFAHFAASMSSNGPIIDCSELHFGNVTKIGVNSFSDMFKDQSIVKSPKLTKITEIGHLCCESMFNSCRKLQTVYAPNVDVEAWTSELNNWVYDAGTNAEEPRIMYVPTQELLDLIPSGNSGYGNYTKQLL